MIQSPELLEDEHEVPTKLGERVPSLPFRWPLDWTMRQLIGMGMVFFIASMQVPEAKRWEDVPPILLTLFLGCAWVTLEYLWRPGVEFWLSVWLEQVTLMLVSLPLWWRRLFPVYGPRTRWRAWRRHEELRSKEGADWPLATLPHWLGQRMLSGVEILSDGVVRRPGGFGRKATFAAAIRLAPRPNPDLLALIQRQGIIQTRLNIFRELKGAWSLMLQVRPFPRDELESSAGPAWEWVSEHVAGEMVERRPVLVISGKDGLDLRQERIAVMEQFHAAGMPAWEVGRAEAERERRELWEREAGVGMWDRARVGLRRVVAGRRAYRSWVVTEMPRVIHLAWLRPITSKALLCRVAFHAEGRPLGATRRSLQRRIRRWRAVDTDEDYALAEYDARRLVAQMHRRQDREVTAGLYVTAFDEQAKKVSLALEAAQCEFVPANGYQHRALRATQAWAEDPVKRTMKLDVRSIATTDLLATGGYWPEGATLIGRGIDAPEPVGLNIGVRLPVERTTNFNSSMFVAILQGGGKTTFACELAWRMANPHPKHLLAEQGLQIVTIDFKRSGDYEPLFRHLRERGKRASYNEWTEGHLPELEGHMGFNLSSVPEEQRGKRVLELAKRLQDWADTHALSRTLLVIVDEILALAKLPEGAAFIQETGTQGRSLSFAPVYCTQHIAPVLRLEDTQMAFTNAGHIFLGRQNPAGIKAMAPLLSLEDEAQVMLANAPRGAGLLRVERDDGPVLIGVQVEPTAWEKFEFGTNPGERKARQDRDLEHLARARVPQNGHVNGTNGHVKVPSVTKSN